MKLDSTVAQDSVLFRQQAFIGGEWVDADDSEVMCIINPSSGELIGAVPKMGAVETKAAIDAAEQAMTGWRKTVTKKRSEILMRWRDLMLEYTDDLAVILTTEQGKPLSEARNEVLYAASYLEWFAEEAKRIYGDIIPPPSEDRRLLVSKEPVGVCAAITPWNFPLAMITRKIGPALAAGCSMVVKPASQTPFSALALAALAEKAGVPAGVYSVVTGSAGDVGGELTRNSTVRKLTFTGSTEVGRELMSQSASTIKKVSLELGGNAPFIVFEDADLDAAVRGAIDSKYRNTGQTCVCTNRFYIHSSVYDEFAKKMVAAVETLKTGDGMLDGVTQGPLIDENALIKVEEHIQDAVEKGGEIISGGARHQLGGNFFEPTVITNATQDMKVASDETFGPLASLFRFDSEEEVIAAANDTEYGLASYFYTRDMARIFRVSEALEYGMVGVNAGLISNEMAPFGGVKQSGIGREGSKYGIDDYLSIKYTCIAGL